MADAEILFECGGCHKAIKADRATAGQVVGCPHCGQNTTVPRPHRVVTLAEAAETQQLQSKPVWEQELIAIEAALREISNQRQEAGNFYKHHASETNRLQWRIEKKDPNITPAMRDECRKHLADALRYKERMGTLDARRKEYESRKAAIVAEHPA